MKKYQYPSGKIVTRDELWELFRRCNPHFAHDVVEFEMALHCDLMNGTLKVVEE